MMDDIVICLVWCVRLYYIFWHRQTFHQHVNTSNIIPSIPKHDFPSRDHIIITDEMRCGFLSVVPFFFLVSFLFKKLVVRFNIRKGISFLSYFWNNAIFDRQGVPPNNNSNTKRENRCDHTSKISGDGASLQDCTARIQHLVCGLAYFRVSEVFLHLWITSIFCYSYIFAPPLFHDVPNKMTSMIESNLCYRYGFTGMETIWDSSSNQRHPWILLFMLQRETESRLLSYVLLIRLIFMLVGVYLGQSMIFVTITGSIATGKSTVGNMLLHRNNEPQQQYQRNLLTRKTTFGSVLRRYIGSQVSCSSSGSVRIIDSDRIGHEILLPPHILSSSIQSSTTPNNSCILEKPTPAVRGSCSTNCARDYTIDPKDSVYDTILQTFGAHNILSDTESTSYNKNCIVIDRRKLGTIIFQDAQKRRRLNQITHPRIMRILIQQILYGVWCGREKIICVDIPLLFEAKSIMKYISGIIVVVACTDRNVQYQRLRQRNPDLSEQECRDRIASQLSMEYKMQRSDMIIFNEQNTTFQDLQQQVNMIRHDISKRLYGIFQCGTMFNCTLLLGLCLLISYQ
jgi:dephospho-CoA kinase